MAKLPIPVYLIKEHNEAYYCWQKARLQGFLQKPADLFHVDAHPDMFPPDRLQRSVYSPGAGGGEGLLRYYRDFAAQELDIGNFILPAVLAGLVKDVYAIYPKWRSWKPQRKKMTVCSAFGEGKVLKQNVPGGQDGDPRVRRAYPDITYFSYAALEVSGIPSGRRVILDIDFDYFACRDSIFNRMHYRLEITREQFRRRESFLGNPRLPFSRLGFRFGRRSGRFWVEVSPPRQKEEAHLPTQEQVREDVAELMGTLRKRKTRPLLVTLCRSSLSGYCPPEFGPFLKTEILKGLETLWLPVPEI